MFYILNVCYQSRVSVLNSKSNDRTVHSFTTKFVRVVYPVVMFITAVKQHNATNSCRLEGLMHIASNHIGITINKTLDQT